MEVALGPISNRSRRKTRSYDKDDVFDFSKPATSAAEYLRRVQIEAALCPEVVVAKELLPTLKPNEDIPEVKTILTPAPHEFIPSTDWQYQQASRFAELRQRINCMKSSGNHTDFNESLNLPSIHNEDKWCIFCLGEKKWNEIQNRRNSKSQNGTESENLEENCCKLDEEKVNQPLLSIVTTMGQRTITRVVEFHLSWLQCLGFSEIQGKWIYALLACLEKPLPPNVSSLLRTLARRCADLRASLIDANDERVAPLNLLITLVTRYFGQTDLAEGT